MWVLEQVMLGHLGNAQQVFVTLLERDSAKISQNLFVGTNSFNIILFIGILHLFLMTIVL